MNTSCTESIKAVQYKLTLFLTRVTRPNHLTDRNTLHLYTSSFTMAAYNICRRMSTLNGWKVHSILSFSCWLGWKHQLTYLSRYFQRSEYFTVSTEPGKRWNFGEKSTQTQPTPSLDLQTPIFESTDPNSSVAPPNEPLSHCLHSDGTMSTPYSTIDWAHPQDLGNGSRAEKNPFFDDISSYNCPSITHHEEREEKEKKNQSR